MGARKDSGSSARKRTPRPWEERFFALLADGQPVKRAADEAGTCNSNVFRFRARHADFAARWYQALASAPKTLPKKALRKKRATARDDIQETRVGPWRKPFIDNLAELSNVAAAARAAHIPVRTVYAERRNDPGFAKEWLAALAEGYDNLELELLGHLRDPTPERKLDVAAGLRLLAAHRETVARERAFRGASSPAETYASIDRFIGRLRDARLKAGKPMISPEPAEGAGDGAS
ncbi:MAG: hypothetical protein WA954_10060 [Parerythrobacter sp.]